MFKLQEGDKIGIITPSNFLDYQTPLDPELKASLAHNRGINPRDAADLAVEYLKSLGLQPILGEHVYDKFRHMGGTPQNRADDFNKFIRNPEIKAVFCSTGGAGAQYMLPYLDYENLRKNPKPIFGISDASTLQIAAQSLSSCPSYNGFSLAYDFKYGKIRPQADIDLKAIISGNYHKVSGGETVISGCAEGTLIGGCLSMLRNLAGTPYFPDFTDKILLIEDIGERTYRIDSMLQQIRQQPEFNKLKGLVFGGFNGCIIRYEEDNTIDQIIDYFCGDLSIPTIKHFPWGHFEERRIVPLGIRGKLNADTCTLSF